MLSALRPSSLTDLDREIFAIIVPEDHYLRRVSAVVDFECFRPRMVDAYNAGLGRPPIEPVLMLKIAFLSFHYGLSDRRVIERARTDMAFRWFLDFGLHDTLPNHTNGTHFRDRLGSERFEAIFQDIVTLAREHGLIGDRLRLKDATHMFADAAELRPLALAAQVRELLLRAAEPFFADWVAMQHQVADNLTQTTAEFPKVERLAARVNHLREMASHLGGAIASWPAIDAPPKQRKLQRMLAVTEKLLADHADPKAGDRLASGVDPDARTGMHHGYFVGYLLDELMDERSEIITAVNLLPGNGAEAADAITLIQQEEKAQGNDVEGISIDGAGYNGPVLRELTDPAGLNLDVTVPPPKKPERVTFGPERFSLTVLEDGRGEVTCPAGQTTRQREQLKDKNGCRYTFKPKQCAGCTMREECLLKPQGKKGRSVTKNDYEAEYRKVQEKAATPEYAQTRRVHPKIERKLNELVRHHGNRRARYRGLKKVLSQSLLTAFVTNIKRIVKLLAQKIDDAASVVAVRAELSQA
jgi:transposase